MTTDRMDKNAEGYADPTAGGAWNNIREMVARLFGKLRGTAQRPAVT